MPKIREIIAGKKCVIYADEQPQVMLIQPVGEHGKMAHFCLGTWRGGILAKRYYPNIFVMSSASARESF